MNLDLTETFRLIKGGKLAQAVEAIQQRLLQPRSFDPAPAQPQPAPATPGTGRFLDLSFTNPSGERPYKLYIPSRYAGQSVPLIVMLHGCTQSPADFATGTRMNAVAEQHTCIVAYPAQVRHANLHRCWNWFSPEDQQRGHGEPSIIAGITQAVLNDYAVDRRRIYIAGLSAGGALAATMAQTYPDLYAAAGIHSGLACGAAHDLQSAMAAMANGAPGKPGAVARRIVPTIVFHGDRDVTVSPANAASVIAQALRDGELVSETQDGAPNARAPNDHPHTTTLFRDHSGAIVGEVWHVHGGGHAWFGGDPAGSYADPRGPDATQEMLRFFLRHRNAT